MYVDIDNGYDAFSLDNTRHTLSDEPGEDKQESSALGLEWQRELDLMQLETALTGATTASVYSFDEDWSYVGIAPGWEYSSTDRYKRDRDSYSATARVLSNERSRLFAGSTDWVAGVYYLGDREHLERRYTYLENDFNSRYDTDTYALFGQLDSQLSERFKLVNGLRLERRLTDYQDNNGVDSDPDKNLWGGRAALEYQVDDEQHAVRRNLPRLSRQRCQRRHPGQPGNQRRPGHQLDNCRTCSSSTRNTWSTTNWVSRAACWQDTLQARLAVFYMDRKDQQVKGSLIIPRPDGSTAFIDYTSNAAQGNNYGYGTRAELAGQRRSLALFANIGLLRTEFDQYTDAAGNDLSGRDQAQAPHYQYAVGGRYEFGGRVLPAAGPGGSRQRLFFRPPRPEVAVLQPAERAPGLRR